MTKEETKRFGDVMPEIEFYPDLPRTSLLEILDTEIEVIAAQIVEEFDSKFGKSGFALLLFNNSVNGEQSTTLCGGIVVIKKVKYALSHNLLPLKGVITYNGRYYDIN